MIPGTFLFQTFLLRPGGVGVESERGLDYIVCGVIEVDKGSLIWTF